MSALASGPASAAAIAASVNRHETSALAVVEAALARIARHNPALNCFTSVTGERALASAGALMPTSRRARMWGHLPASLSP